MEPVDLPEDIVVIKGKGPSIEEIDRQRAREKERMRSGAVETPDFDPIDFIDPYFAAGLATSVMKALFEKGAKTFARKQAAKTLASKAAGKEVRAVGFSTPDPSDAAKEIERIRERIRRAERNELTEDEIDDFFKSRFGKITEEQLEQSEKDAAKRIDEMSDEEFNRFMEIRDKSIEEERKKLFSNPDPLKGMRLSTEEKNRDVLIKAFQDLQAKKKSPPTPEEMAREFLEFQERKAAKKAAEEEAYSQMMDKASRLQEAGKALGLPSLRESLVKRYTDKMKTAENARRQIENARQQLMSKRDLTPAMRREQTSKIEQQEQMINSEIARIRSEIMRDGGSDLLRDVLKKK